MKSTGFGVEVRLGLALIILVLVVLNFASHYALHRIRQSIEEQSNDDLSEAAVVTANSIFKIGTAILPDTTISHIIADYNLQSLSVIPLRYERVLAIQNGVLPDSSFRATDSSLTAEDLMPLLQNRIVYRHKSGDDKNTLLFPTQHAGSKYIIAVTNENGLLKSVESAGRILIFFGILGVGIIIYVAMKFIHLVINPFNRLRQKAEESGRLDKTAGDEVTQVIGSYEKIIDELKSKEAELLRLNDIITRRAENLEIFNNYILKSIDTGIITIDNERNISSINSAASRILGREGADFAENHYSRLLAGYPHLLNMVEQFFMAGRLINNKQLRISRDSGNAITLAVSLSPLSDCRGDNIGLSLIMVDQTEMIKIQEELELNRRMASLGEMSGGLAHQLRNSTAAIVGFAKLIDKRIQEDNASKDNIGLLLREATEASALVGRFLDFARPLELTGANFYLKELLESITLNNKEMYKGAKLTVDSDIKSNPVIWGDLLLLKQAVGNIVDNACRAADKPDGIVRIGVKTTSHSAEIIIADNGSGIPEEFKDKIFTPFFSGSPSGTGLGLPLARKIITLHGGQINFESVPGEGTTFIIILPLSKESPIPLCYRETTGVNS